MKAFADGKVNMTDMFWSRVEKERKKMHVTSIVHFSHKVFKGLPPQSNENSGLCGKESTCESR